MTAVICTLALWLCVSTLFVINASQMKEEEEKKLNKKKPMYKFDSNRCAAVFQIIESALLVSVVNCVFYYFMGSRKMKKKKHTYTLRNPITNRYLQRYHYCFIIFSLPLSLSESPMSCIDDDDNIQRWMNTNVIMC